MILQRILTFAVVILPYAAVCWRFGDDRRVRKFVMPAYILVLSAFLTSYVVPMFFGAHQILTHPYLRMGLAYASTALPYGAITWNVIRTERSTIGGALLFIAYHSLFMWFAFYYTQCVFHGGTWQ